jgi:hypothetical protein
MKTPRYAYGHAEDEMIRFNDLVEGRDVAGESFRGAVRGYGPPKDHYQGFEDYPDQTGPRCALVVVECVELGGLECHHREYVEAFADSIEFIMGLQPAEWEMSTELVPAE